MTYASMMVHVEPGSTSSDARLALGGSLAERLDSVLIGVAAMAVRPPPVDPFGGGIVMGEVMAAEEEQIRAELKEAEDRFRHHPAVRDRPFEWRASIDMPAEMLARESRSADLIIVGRDLEQLRAGAYRSVDPGEIIMAAGRPVLVVPPGTDSLAARQVVVGWKDSREARRAVWDSLPMLRAADAVHVVEVAGKDDVATGVAHVDDLVDHLKRHHVEVRGEVRTQREAYAADELILAAEQHGADLIVVGGYGHTRLREWVLGGVTRDLLRRSPKCCLFSH